jgi:hypothetical protein
MAKANVCNCLCSNYLITGLGLFVIGLIKYLGYSWEMALMAIGILLVLKSLILKGM